MQKNARAGLSYRLLTSAVLTAALAAGTVAAAVPALAATPQPSGPNVVKNLALPKLGARKAPFSSKSKAAATTNGPGPASSAANPWIVGIETRTSTKYGPTTAVCTGTVISATKVLTAAACDTNNSSGSSEIIAGRDDLTDDSVGFVDGVASTWTSPNYDPASNVLQNVEVLTLTQPLPSVYTPIGLTAQGDESPYTVGGNLTTFGYDLNATWPEIPLWQSPVTTIDGSTCSAEQGANYAASEEVCESYEPNSINTFSGSDQGDPLITGDGKQAGIGDSEGPSFVGEALHLPFERLSVFHDQIAADQSRPNPGNLDWTGDGISDLFAVNNYDDVLDYQGNGTSAGGGFGTATETNPDQAGLGWSVNMRGSNWYGDGQENVLHIDNIGQLWSYPQDGNGGINYGAGQVAGTNWGQFTSVVATNNFTGDGRPDLIAERSDGTLWLYERNGQTWLNGNGVQIGSGFGADRLMAFQWKSNGHIGLLADTADGTLKFYGTDGAGHWTNNGTGATIGSGFTDYRVLSVGSTAGHDTATLLTEDGGNLYGYYADGNGGWANGGARTLIGTGWYNINTIF